MPIDPARGLALAAIAVCAVLLGGCGDSKAGSVSGTVTFAGQPVTAGAITFIPLDGASPTAGGIVTDGHYSVKVPVGDMKVVINGTKVIGHKKIYNTADSPTMPVTQELLPAKYSDHAPQRADVRGQVGQRLEGLRAGAVSSATIHYPPT